MNKMKKLSLLLCLALILSVFASCDLTVTVQNGTTDTGTQSTERVEITSQEQLTELEELTTERETDKPTESTSTEVTEESSESTSIEETEESSESTSIEETEESSESTNIEETEESSESTSIEETEEPSESTSIEETEEPSESTSIEETEEPSESTSIEETEEPSESTSIEETEESSESTSIEETEEPSESTSIEETESEVKCAHADKDNNGECDVCYISVIIEFDLYAINDLHGKILDNGSQPGVDELTTYLKNAYKNNPNTILFSSGDMWQGTAESGLTFGKMMIDWMNALDFAFMTIGNHEFDWGEKYIAQNAPLAEFPFLAINIYDSDTRQRAEYCQPSIMIDLGEIQIGFIGAIGNVYSSISGEMQDGFYFVTGSNLTTLVKNEAQSLKAQGADFIVYSIHDSMSGSDISLTRDGYVDIVFEGHSHDAYVKTDASGAYHIQGGGENEGMSYASISFNFANMNSEIVEIRVIKNSEYSKCEPDDIVDTLKEKYDEEMLRIETVLGNNDAYRSSSYLQSLVAKLYASLGETRWSDYNVVLGGGKINCRSPYNLYAGEVKYGDLYSLLPFNNKLALCSIKGRDLLNKYINGSYDIAYTAYGESVKNSIDSNATYYIITDSYNYTYSSNRLTVVEVYDEATYARDLLAEYIKGGGLGKPQGGGTTTPTTPPDVSLTSIPKLLEIAQGLKPNGETTEKYYVKGKITSISSTKYGNVYIEDEEGNSLYVYGIYKDGDRYGYLSDPPVVGDTVILYGIMVNYVKGSNPSIYEMKSAELIYQD